MKENRWLRMALSGMFLALALVLPFLTGQIPALGQRVLPMHLPVLLCGMMCGGPWALAVGLTAPLLRSLLFGMPPMMPVAIAMAFEMGCYGLVAGLLSGTWERGRRRHPLRIYMALIAAMVAGRLVWGGVFFVLQKMLGGMLTWEIFLAEALIKGLPGIILQLAPVPALILAVERAWSRHGA